MSSVKSLTPQGSEDVRPTQAESSVVSIEGLSKIAGAVDQILLDGQTYSVHTYDPTFAIPDSLKKHYPNNFRNGKPQGILVIRNALKDDHPDLFEEGACDADKLRGAGLIITSRIRLRHVMPADTQERYRESDYLLIPAYTPQSLRVERTKDVLDTLDCTIYRDAAGNIFRRVVVDDNKDDGEITQYHPLGRGDEILLMSRLH